MASSTRTTKEARRAVRQEEARRRAAATARRQTLTRLGLGIVALLILSGLAFVFLNRSDDGATNAPALSTLQTADKHSLAISPADPSTVLFGHCKLKDKSRQN